MSARPNYRKLYDDGVHFVRRSSARDAKVAPFTIKSSRASTVNTKRLALSLDAAISEATRLSKIACADDPVNKALFDASRAADTIKQSGSDDTDTSPAATGRNTASALPGQYKAEPVPRPVAFATTAFNCVRANPEAQIWQCVKHPGEITVGRKGKGRVAPKQAPFDHAVGQCAILRGKEPLRGPDGRVNVYSLAEAESIAEAIYYETPEDERWSWDGWDAVVVDRTDRGHFVIEFNAGLEYERTPFSIFNVTKGAPVYAASRAAQNVTRPALASGAAYQASSSEEEDAIALNQKIKRMGIEEARRSRLSDNPQRFRAIWKAREVAQALEDTYYPERITL